MREVSVSELARQLRGDTALIDVREPAEYAEQHIPGARLLPMGQLASRLAELDPAAPHYVVCRSGNRSVPMAELLIAAGFDAVSVAGGTDAWVQAGLPVDSGLVDSGLADSGLADSDSAAAASDVRDGVSVTDLDGITVVVIDTPSLGDRSYLVHDGDVALVVDPQRDIDRITALLDAYDVRLTHVFETHIHNDYVTGGFALARARGAAYLVNADDPVTFERTGIRDGDVLAVGERMRVKVMATPGHTFTHLSYALADAHSGPESVAVFSGGSLLFGATGRPDLLGPAHTHELVRHQHHSAHRLAAELPDTAEVFPTHGFGSFCSATQAGGTASTIGRERRHNPVLTQDLDSYVRELLAGLGAHPAYYAHMAPANSAGPDAPDLSTPHRADPTELRRRIDAGEWVVDLRNRTAFAAGHTRGTLNFGIDGGFTTYLGWLIEWGTPLSLVGDSAEDVAAAQRELVRIGIDRVEAQATGAAESWTEGGAAALVSFPVATFADLAQVRHHRTVTVLDVRRVEEFDELCVLGALNIPLHELADRLDELPPGEIWVHCAGGYRASVAASLLHAYGRDLVAIDDVFENAIAAGLNRPAG